VSWAAVLAVALLPWALVGHPATAQDPATAAAASSASPLVTQFVLPTSNSGPMDVAAGPGGTLWVTEYNANKVARLSLTGTGGVSIQEFWVPTSASQPSRIAAGPDGNMWFTEYNALEVSRITPAGGVTSYAWPAFNAATDITTGADGNLWVPGGTADKVSRLTTSGEVTEYAFPAGSAPVQVAAGADGNLWVTEVWGNRVAKLTTGGTYTEYTLPTGESEPRAITAGPDGNLWIVEMAGDKVARVTTDGVITEFALPTKGSRPWGIAAGPDGNLWVTETNAGQLARITPTGDVTEYALAPAGSGLLGIETGADGNLWVVVRNTNSLVRIQVTSTVSFAAAAATVQENAGTALLTVTRTGDTSGSSTVHYARTAGTAGPATDFSLPPGDLTFAAGQLTRTIAVPVTNDSLSEGPETVVVTLSDPSSARLGPPVSTTLTIAASDQRPDGLISTASASGYIGNNIYNTTAAGQTRTATAPRSKTRTFYARVYNDGNVVNTFTIKGSAAPAGAQVHYYRGTTDITPSLLSAAGWKARCTPGSYVIIRMVIRINPTARIGSTKAAKLTATWTGDGTRSDRVGGVVHVVR